MMGIGTGRQYKTRQDKTTVPRNVGPGGWLSMQTNQTIDPGHERHRRDYLARLGLEALKQSKHGLQGSVER